MISGKKEGLDRKGSQKSPKANNSAAVVSISSLQRAKKIEDAKRRVYAAAEKLNW